MSKERICNCCHNVRLTPEEGYMCEWCEKYQFDFSVQTALGFGNDVFSRAKHQRDVDLGFMTQERADELFRYEIERSEERCKVYEDMRKASDERDAKRRRKERLYLTIAVSIAVALVIEVVALTLEVIL